ncbi:hypothetical protein K3172_06665 [Qipengyuania sp. 6B39]|uniref:hypothetical protein n=1 Tax=Qipengyuania proteolytica TaxID=2867239 RepID=UPI001C892365|nr:hypothetical protein [Qipengyuania proteolytica]MBX7495539.1 hypothetical protein [Qipengyuania proteolytica]
MHSYRHSGLAIASGIELPEWQAFRVENVATADVEIVLSDRRSPSFPADGSTAVKGDTVCFAVEGVGGWEIVGGRRMVLHPSLAADPREVRLFTLGSAWGLLGYQRGHAMWHGSAVEMGGHSVLFCGDAGEGKSTMAAAMLDAGAALVADDLSRIEPAADGALIHPSSTRIKLWGEAVDHFGWRERVIERDWMREDKFHCRVPVHLAGDDAVRLAAIVVLATGENVALEPVTGAEAMTAVLAGTIYRPEALEAMGRWAEQGALAAQTVAQCPVWRLTRPRDLGALSQSVVRVTELLASLG